MSGFLRQSVDMLLPALPVLVAYLIGITLATTRYRQAPKSSILAIIAFLMMFVTRIGGVLFFVWLVQTPSAQTAISIRPTLLASTIMQNCIYAVGTGMLIAAIYIGRTPVQTSHINVPKTFSP